jgi:hypothetical protein
LDGREREEGEGGAHGGGVVVVFVMKEEGETIRGEGEVWWH